MHERLHPIHIRRGIMIIFCTIPLLFFSAALLTSAPLKEKIASERVRRAVSQLSTDWFIYAYASENRYFRHTLSETAKMPSFSSLIFRLTTGIRPGDIRSLLGNELPSFAIYDSEIYIAGEGTNYTNLPYESPPPMELLMMERKIAREKLTIEDEREEPKPGRTTGGKPVVYVYQTHSYESFLPLLKNADSPQEAYVTDPRANMIAIGKKLAAELEQRGIGVIHETTKMQPLLLKKGLEHQDAYQLARTLAVTALEEHESLKYLFDLHRDAARREETTVVINGVPYARLAFVIGKENRNFEENLYLAKQLHHLLEKKYPGLSRGVIGKKGPLTNGVFNQDLSGGAVLIEVGGVDNTLKELYRSVEALADVFADYYWKHAKKQ